MRAAVARNGYERHIQQLLNDPDPLVRNNAGNPLQRELSSQLHDERFYSHNPQERAELASDPNYLSWETLANDPDPIVRRAVVKRAASLFDQGDEEPFNRHAYDFSIDTDREIAQTILTTYPHAFASQYAMHPDPAIRKQAQSYLTRKERKSIKEGVW